jgi:sulfur transfer complex TusBCD TusB component (DsrH family)
MGHADNQAAWQQCLQQAAAGDSILLLGEAVLLTRQPEFEKQLTRRHIVACDEHWQQLTSAAQPAAVMLLTWPQIVQLIKQHPLQQSWA